MFDNRKLGNFAKCFLAGCCLILVGCATPKAPHAQGDFDAVQSTSFWQPHLLYLLASPYPRLYVEVDAVEGCVPSDAALDKLRNFLAAYCHKPGGIEIVRSDVIPASIARGISAGSLARKYLNGPPTNVAAPPPAFMYVLYYDSALSAKTAPRSHAPIEHPRVEFLPYPAMIYMNTRYGPKMARDEFPLHEAGHLMGLVGRRTYATNHHCLDSACLMNKTLFVHIGRLMVGMDPIKQRQLCKRCVAELTERSKEPPPSNLRFVGPVLVRLEAGYQVLSLPDRVAVIPGDLDDNDCWKFVATVRSEKLISGEKDELRVFVTVKKEMLNEPAKMLDIIKRASADPFKPVRSIAPGGWAQVCAGKYLERGQFTNAVNFLREAIALNPKDNGSYNQLAWIKATCTDTSVRDGKEAVSAAGKACELSNWKEWNVIDTLAAAYAETGDFKRAIEFQEQALRTGNPTESDQKEMQERLSLYQQSRPFRDKP